MSKHEKGLSDLATPKCTGNLPQKGLSLNKVSQLYGICHIATTHKNYSTTTVNILNLQIGTLLWSSLWWYFVKHMMVP